MLPSYSQAYRERFTNLIQMKMFWITSVFRFFLDFYGASLSLGSTKNFTGGGGVIF
jgi:hypothetical protein